MQTTIAAEQGNLDQERRNIQSTKSKPEKPAIDNFPIKALEKTQDYYCIIVNNEAKETSYSDLTGKFPYQSSRGHQYIFIMYDYDANAIVSHPIKTRQASEITEAWEICHRKLCKNGNTIKAHIMDNEDSEDIKTTMAEYNIAYQLAPPHQHRRNAAERAIRTYKNHLLAGIATCDPKFPIREWDRLLEKCDLTLNLLRNSRINPKLSA